MTIFLNLLKVFIHKKDVSIFARLIENNIFIFFSIFFKAFKFFLI
jgi:hypothetical protein